eukprot:4071631-Ditylum_brightwellii.AAC.1
MDVVHVMLVYTLSSGSVIVDLVHLSVVPEQISSPQTWFLPDICDVTGSSQNPYAWHQMGAT